MIPMGELVGFFASVVYRPPGAFVFSSAVTQRLRPAGTGKGFSHLTANTPHKLGSRKEVMSLHAVSGSSSDIERNEHTKCLGKRELVKCCCL